MKTNTNSDGHTIWHFTRAELVALLAHMGADETRPAMASLVLDTGKGRAHVTDGHRAALVTTGDRLDHDQGIVGVYVVPRGLIESAVKVAKAGSWIMVMCADGRAKVSVDSTALDGPLVENKPPPVDAILNGISLRLPGKHKGVAQGFNGWYLADISLVCNACPPRIVERPKQKKEKHYSSVLLFPGQSDLEPMVAEVQCATNQCKWSVVLMPMRI